MARMKENSASENENDDVLEDMPADTDQEIGRCPVSGVDPDEEILREAALGIDSDEEILREAERIDALKQEVEAGKDRYLRLIAEFDNYKRRTSKEYERLIENANEKLILEIVDVRGNFERALKASENGGEFAPFFDGMKMIFTKLEEVLSRNGLSVFAETGEEFDPAVHDALMNAPHADIPVDHIVEVFERGYRLKDKIVKHARVIVSSGPNS